MNSFSLWEKVRMRALLALASSGARVAAQSHASLFAHHQQHRKTADRAEARHNRVPDAPAVAIDQPTGQRQRNGGAVILKGIDHATGESGHSPPSDIHR